MEFYVNGQKVTVAQPDAGATLLSYLRDELGLTGTKLACGEGGCGACTVMVSRWDAQAKRPRHFAVNACLAPLCSVDGMAVTTVEGIGSMRTRLHPVQEVLVRSHGTQCGFCTPGIIMSMYTLLRNNPHPTEAQILSAFDGNLCRCTGYRPIVQGFSQFAQPAAAKGGAGGCCGGGGGQCPCRAETSNRRAASEVDSASTGSTEHSDDVDSDVSPVAEQGAELKVDSPQPTRASSKAPYTVVHESQEVIFPPALIRQADDPRCSKTFHGANRVWHSPANLSDLLNLLTAEPKARLVGGNTEIGVEVMVRQVRPSVYISTAHVPELHALQHDPERQTLVIGSAVTLQVLEGFLHQLACTQQDAVAASLPVAIVEALHLFAGPQIRAVATVGGNLANASPISDLNPIWLATNTSIEVASAQGRRRIAAAEFFKGYRTTSLQNGEVIVALHVPYNTHAFVAWYKQSRRREDDIAIVNGCFRLELSGKTVQTLDAAFGGMAAVTMRVEQLRPKIISKEWNVALIDDVHGLLTDLFNLNLGTPGGMPVYRMSLTLGFFTKFFWQAQAAYFGADSVPPELRSIVEPSDSKQQSLKATQIYDELGLLAPKDDDTAPVGKSAIHRSAVQQVTGEAKYIDDHPPLKNELHAAIVVSSKAHARIVAIDATEALAMPGVVGVYTGHDVPGSKLHGPLVKDEEVIATDEVGWIGQCVAVVAAVTKTLAEEASKKVRVMYEDLPSVLTIEEAIAANSFHGHENLLQDGDVDKVLASAPHKLSGELEVGGQEHFYFETQCCIAIPSGEGEMELISSTQQPNGAQAAVAEALGISYNRVRCITKRIGGGFGGKESRAAMLAVLPSVAAYHTNRPVRLILPRNIDMLWSGGRNPFLAKYQVGYDNDGRLLAMDMQLYLNAGWTADLSLAVMEKAVLHVEGAYYCPNVRIRGAVCRTNLASNTAFRGFGAPQAMIVMETIMNNIALKLNQDQLRVRQLNFYKNGDVTAYGQTMKDEQMNNIWQTLLAQVDVPARRSAVDAFNRGNMVKKRGLAVIPTKFGVCFEPTFLNQGSAQVHLLLDGSVQLHYGGVEMGQGLTTKMVQVCATALGVPLNSVHCARTCTDTAVNEPATAASLSSDRFGLAIMDACQQLNERLQPYRQKTPEATFAEICKAAYLDRVSLMACGFGKIEGIHFDMAKMKGEPYQYWCWGAAFSEVEIDTLTGDMRILRSDMVMDVGKPLNPRIDIGQIEGAFMQGVGLFTMEQKVYLADGRDMTVGPGSYKIPALDDIPREFNVHILRYSPHRASVHSSKAIGEPPLFLGAAVYFAIKDAITAHRQAAGLQEPGNFALHTPATCERIRLACADKIITQLQTKADGTTTGKPWALQHV